MYYPCSENKGADQLRGYCEADLRLCFRIRRLLVFSKAAHIYIHFVRDPDHTSNEMKNAESPLCLVCVRPPLWPHVRQAKFCLPVCQVVFLGVLPFSPHLLIGPSHMS